MRIGVNCGHTVSGTIGSGAVGYINESDETREVGNRLINILVRQGHQVFDCTNDRAGSVSENLSAICAIANAQPLDLFVSIHFNSGGGKGCEVYTYGGKKHDEAVRVCDSLHELGFVDRGIKDGSHLYVIRHTDTKAMLIEVCFVDTKTDTGLYNSIGPARIAQAIADAITGEVKEESEELTMTQYEELKKEIQNLKPVIYNYMDDNMPSWAKPTIQKLMDKGVLVGDDEGKLGLTMDMIRMCVVLDRAGLF